MFNRIRNVLMSQDENGMLAGEVEVDETFIIGRMRNSERRQRAATGVVGSHREKQVIVFGAAERGGPIRATVVPDSRGKTVLTKTMEYVLPRSLIYTDEYVGYEQLGRIGYRHKRIKHAARIYVDGETHTQTIDGFFGLLKNGIRATHHGVSHKWLQGYLNEYVWRWNRRDNMRSMFNDLLAAATA